MTPKAKWRKEFVPEYLYIEEYYYPCPIPEKSSDKNLKPEEEENRGVVIIDLVTYEEEK